MFFNKKKKPSSSPQSQENHDDTTKDNLTAENKETLETAPAENSANLIGKLFNNYDSDSGPEAPYENEAWAPDNGYVGLFRKRRAITEEQSSSSSGPQ